MTTGGIPDKIPFVGVGCILVRDGKLLLVRNQRGFWSTPGGHLDFGESPEVCAARETFEETGVSASNIEFVAITNDVLADAGKHYLTVWMRGEADGVPGQIGDPAEIDRLGWFAPDRLPSPLHLYFRNLLDGHCWPRSPANLPFKIPANRKRVLFVCVENSNRSQMAEAFARIHGGDAVDAYSAGSRPSGVVNPKAIASMAELGYDLSKHGSKSLDEIPNVEYDFVATMGCSDSCASIPAKRRENWQVPDPKQLAQGEFNQVRDLIESKVKAALANVPGLRPSGIEI